MHFQYPQGVFIEKNDRLSKTAIFVRKILVFYRVTIEKKTLTIFKWKNHCFKQIELKQ